MALAMEDGMIWAWHEHGVTLSWKRGDGEGTYFLHANDWGLAAARMLLILIPSLVQLHWHYLSEQREQE